MGDHTDVFISSTSEDLKEHRQMAIRVCTRLGLHYIAMEDFSPDRRGAVEYCREQVEKAEVYLGIYAHRYGWQPSGYDGKSITELEYEWAIAKDIPILIWVVDENALWLPKFIDKGEAATRLEAFKKRVMGSHIIRKFTADTEAFREDLFVHVPKAIDTHKNPAATIHYVSDIPTPPAPYIAHPYTLLQTGDVVGRRGELALLTDWVAKPSSAVYQARILNFVAIGGMGKSALTWKWFNEIAPQELKPLAGRLWWSFYESDASFENFIIRALAYVSGRSREQIEQETKPGEREDQLLQILNQQPFLLVLDGLERILIAYARMDAAHLSDSDYDKQTANYVAGAVGLPESAAQSFVGEHRLRKTADPRAGAFLRKLAGVKQSRILVSTRLYPVDLQNVTGAPLPGCYAVFLKGLHDDDAVELWRAMGVSGSRDTLLPVFRQFENYPLLIRALAGEVAKFRRAPGDFDAWLRSHPDFQRILAALRQQDAKSHVLSYALKSLTGDEKRVLNAIAAFRMPASYDTLVSLLVEPPPAPPSSASTLNAAANSPSLPGGEGGETGFAETRVRGVGVKFASESALDTILFALEDRGVLGWDRRANRYDLHPIVRSVVWNGLDETTRESIYTARVSHFEPISAIDQDTVAKFEDLTPAVELYHTLIRLGRYDDAIRLFYDRLQNATLYRLSAGRQRAELLERLFPDGLDHLPRLTRPDAQAYTLNALAQAYQLSGLPGQAAPLFRQHNLLREKHDQKQDLSVGLGNLSNALRLSGSLYAAEHAARQALRIIREQSDTFWEAVSLYLLGLALAARHTSLSRPPSSPHPSSASSPSHTNQDAAFFSLLPEGEGKHPQDAGLRALLRSRHIFIAQNHTQLEGVANAYLAQLHLWRADPAAARPLADRAWQLAHHARYEADFIQSARLQGEAALGLHDFTAASERLHHALTRARAVNLVEEELPALIALASLARQQGDPAQARDHLEGLWDAAERGPYPPFYADALNVLAQLERDAGNTDAAIKAATGAYEKAWCDGISADGTESFAYWWGLQQAKTHLTALGAPVSVLPPFDPSKFEPMPEVEINPHDDYYVDPDSDLTMP